MLNSSCEIKVSVIVPVYNAQNYLEKCITSLLFQNIDAYEIICVDDGSTDKSVEILDTYATLHPEILHVYHTENRGVWVARQYGVEKAKGKYIGFCDSDDTVAKEMYRTLFDRAEGSKAEMAVCAFKRIDAITGYEHSVEMITFGCKTLKLADDIGELALVNASLWNKIYLAEVIKKCVKFVNPPRIAEDMMVLASIYPELNRIAFIDKPLYNYHVRVGSAIKSNRQDDIDLTKSAMIETKKYVLSKHENVKYDELLDLMAFIHLGIALPIFFYKDKNIKTIINDTKSFLSESFPTWRNNQYLSFQYISTHNKSLLRPKMIQILYNLGVFSTFLRIYGFLIEKFKIEKKMVSEIYEF